MRYKVTNMLSSLSPKFKKRKFNPNIIDIDDINLPIEIKNMNKERVFADIKTDLNTYKLLGYRFKSEGELEGMKEYHSLQIGIMLQGLKINYDLQMRENVSNYFPESIAKLHYHTIQGKVLDLIKKYDKVVTKTLSENQLHNEVIWTPIDAAYILYYLSFYWKKDLEDQ